MVSHIKKSDLKDQEISKCQGLGCFITFLLSAINPPKCVNYDIHRNLAKFLGNFKKKERSTHWIAWEKICLPKIGGDLEFWSLFDISKAFFAKL